MIYQKQKGFTLIELLVVVTIIGILAAAAIPKLLKAMDKARVGRCNADIAAVKSASSMYYMDKTYYPTNQTGLTTDYLDKIPTGGIGAGGTVTLASSGTAFTITCSAAGSCNVYYENTVGNFVTAGTGCP